VVNVKYTGNTITKQN